MPLLVLIIDLNMNDKQSQRALNMLKLHHARLKATRPELLPAWQANYIDTTAPKPHLPSYRDPLHEAYGLLLDKTRKDESVDYSALLESC